MGEVVDGVVLSAFLTQFVAELIVNPPKRLNVEITAAYPGLIRHDYYPVTGFS